MKKFKRRNFVIDRRFQFGMISLFLGAVLIALFVSTIGMVIYYWARYSAGENKYQEYIVVYTQKRVTGSEDRNVDPAAVEEAFQPAAGERLSRVDIVMPPLLINNLAIMVVIALSGIFFSHRISGPLYRIEQVIDEAIRGEGKARIHLRPRDFSHELAHKVNSLLDKIELSK
jgi:hypothetical protein